MADRTVKVAIIGAGSAGLAALRQVRKVTEDVLLIEGGPFGTTCARVGCMPSKLLIAAASAASHVREASSFGIDASLAGIDGKRVMGRVRALRDRFVDNVIEAVEKVPDAMKLRGEARFDEDGTLIVESDAGGRSIEAERVVIATGSRPTLPGEFADHPLTLTSDAVFDWRDLPRSVAVFGGGLIGLELGQALSRLGVRTRIFGKDGAVGPLTDEVLLEAARSHFRETLDFVPHFSMVELGSENGKAKIRYTAEGAEHSASFDHILVAIGRTPNVDALNLSSTTLELDGAGVPVFDRTTGQCGDSAIFIAGDATDEVPLLHEAVDGGTIAGANAVRFPDVKRRERHAALSIVYCEPQIAMVGESLSELKERQAAFEVGEVDWSGQGRALVMGEAAGRLRLYAETGSAKLLGAEMFGPRAEHLAHLLAFAMNREGGLAELMDTPIYHPTFEEGLCTAIKDAFAKLGHDEAPLPYGLDRGPGA